MLRSLAVTALAVACACGGSAPDALTPDRRPELRIGRAARPEWSYWQPVDVTLRPRGDDDSAIAFPLAETDVKGLPAGPVATALREEGLRYEPSKAQRMSAAYRDLAARGVPVLVTADSLFFATHVAIERALDQAERGVLAGDLQALLDRAYVRLSTEALTSPPDLVAGYRLARAVLGVALVLFDEKTHQVPPDLQAIVAAEAGLVRKHVGSAQSPLFGFPLDYGALAPEGAATTHGALTGPHLALSWLAAAPFALAARTEVRESPVSVARARDAVRAALLLANATDPQNDPTSAAAYERLHAALRFELGPSDDASLAELAKVAEGIGITVADRRTFSSPVRADALRHALFAKREIQVYDGVFALGVASSATSAKLGRSAASVRMFGSYASVDAGILDQLLFPKVGPRSSAAAKTAHPRAWQQVRVLPTALDLLAWMGSSPARAQLTADGDDTFEGFGAALERAKALYSSGDSPRAHSSIYDSWFDATTSFVQKSYADEAEPAFERPSYATRKGELAACAWAIGRHDAEPFGRSASALGSPGPVTALPDVFIESNPETYARLLALVRQTDRGLTAMGLAPKTGAPVLHELDGLLEVALTASANVINDAPAPEALATLPLGLAAFEEKFGAGDAGAVTVVADVHADSNSARVLHVGVGSLRELVMVMSSRVADPALVVARGPVLGYREHRQDARERLDDRRWRELTTLPALPPFDR